MAECKIMKCTCKHEGQDQMYGTQNRLWNPIGKGSDLGKDYRCSVCGKSTSGSTKKK